jgi:hypothetical protein
MDRAILQETSGVGEPGTGGKVAAVQNGKPNTDNLLCALIAASTEIAQLRVELHFALEQAEQWRTRYEHSLAWNGRERRGSVAKQRWDDPRPPAPRAHAGNGRASRMVIGATVLAILVTLATILALAPSWAPQMFEGLGVGVGVAAAMASAMWAGERAGTRHGHRLFAREQLSKGAGVAPIPRPAPRPTARASVAR